MVCQGNFRRIGVVMDHLTGDGSESRFSIYVEGLVEVIGHADRAAPLRDYCLGLLMPGERKSVEPMAAVTAPARVAAQHQSLLHFVGNAPWSDERVLARVRELVLPAIERHAGRSRRGSSTIPGFPRRAGHSVGVARQYCGQLGKQDNCQVAVTLSIANHSCQPADRLPAVSAAGMGRGCRAPGPGGGAGSDEFCQQTRDRAGRRSAPRWPPVLRRASC